MIISMIEEIEYPIEVRIKYEVTNYEKSKFVVRKPAPLDSLNSPRRINLVFTV